MTQQDRHWWEQMRAKGRGSFIFREGILRYGARVTSILAVLQVAFIIVFTRESIPLFKLILGWIFSAAFFGWLIGSVLWKQHEKDYHQDDHVA